MKQIAQVQASAWPCARVRPAGPRHIRYVPTYPELLKLLAGQTAPTSNTSGATRSTDQVIGMQLDYIAACPWS
jgi:hypothetical protein